MTITTPSGYKVTFKEENELTYGDRRQIKRAVVRSVTITQNSQSPVFTGEVGLDMVDETLKVMLKEIIKPDGNKVTTDLFEEVMSWKNIEDGDAVFAVIESANNTQQEETPKKK